MGLFGKKTTVVHFNDCRRCNGTGSVTVTVDPADAPDAKEGYKGKPYRIRQTCPQCGGTSRNDR
jgi:hypothetical protein